MPGVINSPVAGHFALTLGAVECGYLKSASGGSVTADVVTERVGPGGSAKKHLGPPRYEALDLRVPFSISKQVYQWIGDSWSGKPAARSGAITMLDVNGEPVARRAFEHALIAETTFPGCDAASKDAAYLTVKLIPEITRDEKPAKVPAPPATKGEQSTFRRSNFKLDIDGLDCTRVSKIDAFTVKQGVRADLIGDARDYQREPTSVEFPSLRIQLAANSAKSWRDWFADFVVKGNNGDDAEKNGTLMLLAPDLKSPLATISLHGLGIYRLDDDWASGSPDAIRRVTAQLYCERMELAIGGAAPVVAAAGAAKLSLADRVGGIIRR